MKLKKLLGVVLACAVLFCCTAVSAFAVAPTSVETAPISPRYVNFSSVWADINKTSWGYYNVSGGAATYSNDITVEVTVYVEGYYSDGQWHQCDDWEVTGSGTALANAAGSRTIDIVGTYRAHTVAEAYRNGVLVETVEAYSTNVVVI